MLFDTHAHYNDERFNDFEGGYKAAIKASFDAGIVGFINCGTNPASSKESIRIAEEYENCYAAVGLHPEDAVDYQDSISEVINETKLLANNEKVVAIGEIGLDYHWDIEKDLQHNVFDIQLSLAEELSLPVIIHDRDAHGKTFDIISAHPNVIGVMHGYSGSAEMVKEYVKRGWYIAFGGPLTYKTAEKVREACKAVPLDRLLIETDCPYLPPVPHRGEINYSAYMNFTADMIANVKGTPREILDPILLSNTQELFKISF